MSEYQYYEFAAIDRPLTEKEMDELGELSSRAEITPTSFTNVYNFGDFRGDPRKMMEKYFDLFVYVANWGTYRTMIRVPKWALDPKQLKPYVDGEVVLLHARGENLIVEFAAKEEAPADWVEGQGWLQSLRPVRDALLAGDLRPFYLGWLRAAVQGEGGDDKVEPPVPPGLGKLSAALKSLAEFLRIDVDLVTAAAAGNRETAVSTGPSSHDFAGWIARLDDRDKNAWLLALLEGEGARARSEALQAFHKSKAKAGTGSGAGSKTPGRTAAELLAAAEALREERLKRERERKAKAAAEARKKHLDALAGREAAAWKEIDALLAASNAKAYETAVALLSDLRDVAASRGRVNETQERIDRYRERFARRPALMRLFRTAGL
jgi:hypothetical protein